MDQAMHEECGIQDRIYVYMEEWGGDVNLPKKKASALHRKHNYPSD